LKNNAGMQLTTSEPDMLNRTIASAHCEEFCLILALRVAKAGQKSDGEAGFHGLEHRRILEMGRIGGDFPRESSAILSC
jgi:hypothetical protein